MSSSASSLELFKCGARCAVLFFIVLGIDLGTKAFFWNRGDARITTEYFGLVELPETVGLFFMAGVIAMFAGWAVRECAAGRAAVLPTLVCAGAGGNFFDRLVFGGVRDWIPILGWSTINVADVSIAVGASMLAILTLVGWRQTT